MVQQVSLTAHQPEQANEMMRSIWGGGVPHSSGDRSRFRFAMHDRSLGGLGISRIDYSMRWQSTYEEFDGFAFCYVAKGRLTHTQGGDEVIAGPGGVLTLLPGRPTESRIDDIRGFPLRLPRQAVLRVAQQRTGRPASEFAFLSMSALSPELARTWFSSAQLLVQQLSPPSPLEDSPLLLAALEDYLAATALATFPNTTMTLDPLAPGQVEAGPVKRAMEYIEANAAQDVTLEDVAGAAGVGVRALQEGFRRHEDTTPMGFLRQVRLRRARAELLDPQPATTVAQVARRWGYGRADRFSAAYREAFEESPHATLRTAQPPGA